MQLPSEYICNLPREKLSAAESRLHNLYKQCNHACCTRHAPRLHAQTPRLARACASMHNSNGQSQKAWLSMQSNLHTLKGRVLWKIVDSKLQPRVHGSHSFWRGGTRF
eukprot:4325551-Pleurochrysis_carterae.AAC.5